MNMMLDVHFVNAVLSAPNSGNHRMSQSVPGDDANGARIILGLLESVDRDGAQSQRRLATELDIALGLVNAYIKRCVKKGLLKVRHAPAGRYADYLTPRGFSEKSRLTLEFLSFSFSFFRDARADCARVFEAVRARGLKRVVLVGRSDLTEIATICALESEIVLVAVVDANATTRQFLNIPLVKDFAECSEAFDAVVVTDLMDARAAAAAATAVVGAERVFVPRLLKPQVGSSGSES
jgi:DNA-binding MarR family transcriptional regulator